MQALAPSAAPSAAPCDLHVVPLESLGERYRRYRLADPHAEAAMGQSLARWGQLAPLVLCRRGAQGEVVDGFKRLTAARQLGWSTLLTRELATDDERTIKAAVYGLNRVGQHLQELEEAWLVQALVREDGLSQGEVAQLLGRHKSWVCRRLALLEKLSDPVKTDLEVGLVSPSLARQLVRLPTGNQAEVLAVSRRAALTALEVQGVVDLWLGAAGAFQRELLLTEPREALRRAQQPPAWASDPRLSAVGNRSARQLAQLLEALTRWLSWRRCPGVLRWSGSDGPLLQPALEQLVEQARQVAAETTTLLDELGPERTGEAERVPTHD